MPSQKGTDLRSSKSPTFFTESLQTLLLTKKRPPIHMVDKDKVKSESPEKVLLGPINAQQSSCLVYSSFWWKCNCHQNKVHPIWELCVLFWKWTCLLGGWVRNPVVVPATSGWLSHRSFHYKTFLLFLASQLCVGLGLILVLSATTLDEYLSIPFLTKHIIYSYDRILDPGTPLRSSPPVTDFLSI